MAERKPPDQSWESFAEQQIRAAQAAGDFDHLPGLGRPLAGLEGPPDENWWLKEKLKRERLSILPPALEIARDAADTLGRIDRLSTEQSVRRELTALNERIRAAQRTATYGPATFTPLVDVEERVAQWRSARPAGPHHFDSP